MLCLSSDQFKVEEAKQIRIVQNILVQGVSMIREPHTKTYEEYLGGLLKNLVVPLRGAHSNVDEAMQAVPALPADLSVPLVADWLSSVEKAAV